MEKQGAEIYGEVKEYCYRKHKKRSVWSDRFSE